MKKNEITSIRLIAGIGFNPADLDKEWTNQQEGFNELLQQLQSGQVEEQASPDHTAEADLSGKSLELKSKTSRARVQ